MIIFDQDANDVGFANTYRISPDNMFSAILLDGDSGALFWYRENSNCYGDGRDSLRTTLVITVKDEE